MNRLSHIPGLKKTTERRRTENILVQQDKNAYKNKRGTHPHGSPGNTFTKIHTTIDWRMRWMATKKPIAETYKFGNQSAHWLPAVDGFALTAAYLT